MPRRLATAGCGDAVAGGHDDLMPASRSAAMAAGVDSLIGSCDREKPGEAAFDGQENDACPSSRSRSASAASAAGSAPLRASNGVAEHDVASLYPAAHADAGDDSKWSGFASVNPLSRAA